MIRMEGVRYPVIGPVKNKFARLLLDSPLFTEERRGPESNRRIQLLQSRALPLGYPAV